MRCQMDAPDAVTTVNAIRNGTSSVEQIVAAAITRIEAMEAQVRAWACFEPERALAEARALDRRLAAGTGSGPLAGLPIGMKDLFDTQALPTAYGSPIYRGRRPAADAWVVTASAAAGAVVMGKTVTTEFGYFTPGPTANPWDLGHTPGGSSSGSAAAVASGMVPLAFGSQTAGSLIRPASYCGVFALKPGFGRFSLAGAKPFAPSLDTLGWLARSADDLELMRAALAGEAFQPLRVPALGELRLLASVTHESACLEPAGRRTWEGGLERLRRSGADLGLREVPANLIGLVDAQKTVMAYEASRSLAHEMAEARDGLSEPIRSLIRAGQEVSDTQYQAGLALAELGRRQIAELMRACDGLIVPAAPGEAPAGLDATGDPVFSRVWTLLGLPCVNVPGLLGPHGLPLGLQVVGHPGGERRLLEVAASLHRSLSAANESKSL